MKRRDEAIHSLEAEQSIIGALLLDNAMLDRVPQLKAEHFFRADLRAIFDRTRQMIIAGKQADVLTVAESGVCDLLSLNDMANSVVRPEHIGAYAAIVIDRAMQRGLHRVGTGMAERAVGMEPVAQQVDTALAELTALTEDKPRTESVGIDDAIVDFLDHLQAQADGQGEVFSTGFIDIDELLAGGFRRGEVIVLGGRPKMGKTTLTLEIARFIARTWGVLFCSQEMPVRELMARHASALGRVHLREIRQPAKMSDQGWTGISDAVELLKGLRLTQDEQRSLTLLDVRRKVMEAKRKKGCDVVFIDFLQLMAGDGDNRNQALDGIANGLKAMAGEFGVAVVILSQMSREADKRHGPPVMTDLRDSGAIEAAADVIALLYREYAHPLGARTEQWKHYAQLEVIQRNGAPGTVPLWFGGEHQQFRNWTGSIPSREFGGGGKGRSGVRSTGME